MSKLLLKIRKELKEVGDAKKALAMQAYMKSQMPYHGVPAPKMTELVKTLFKEVEFSSFSQWEKTIQDIWRGAKFREERYAALRLCGHKNSKEFQTPEAMNLYEEMIVTGAWWDFVDEIASHKVGGILRNYPKEIKKQMLEWSEDENMWKRRTSILCQLGFKKETDLKFLYRCIEPSLDSKEFFLRKAIGWALRQYAWTDPKEIKRYVKSHQTQLSSLSQREALKNI